jgi:alanine racemase
MNRLGFTSEQVQPLIAYLKEHPAIEIRSVFSHLAASDDPGHDDFTRTQLRTFELLSERIIREFDYPILRHILNTGGIERFPDGQYDMVRLGIGLYGISSQLSHKLRPVNKLKSVLSQVRLIKPGDTVGYNRAFIAARETRIGIVPIGYADGLNRALGNGTASLQVSGKGAPIIGNVCMDMCMIDLTGISAEEGDEVIIFKDANTLGELAEKSGTIPYEVLAGISERVKRIYYQ